MIVRLVYSMAANSYEYNNREDLPLEELSPFLKCEGMCLQLGKVLIRVYRILPPPSSIDLLSLSSILGVPIATPAENQSVLQWEERLYVWDSHIVDLTFLHLRMLNQTLKTSNLPASLETLLESPNNKLLVSPTQSPPYSGICYIKSTFPDGTIVVGSGWLASCSLVITSGFLLYCKLNGGYPSQIAISPGKDGDKLPNGEILVSDKRCILLPSSSSIAAFGGILVSGKLHKCFSWKTAVLSDVHDDCTLSIAGYCGGSMLMTGVQVEYHTADKFYYKYTSVQRECGAPVWAILDEPGVFHVVGVQDMSSRQLYSSATRFTQELLDEIDHWNLATRVLSLINECEYKAATDQLIGLQKGSSNLFDGVIAVLNSSFDIFKIGYYLMDNIHDGTYIVKNFFNKCIADILISSLDETRCFHLDRVEDCSRLSLCVYPNRILGDNIWRCAMFHGSSRPNYTLGANLKVRPYFQNGVLLYFHLDRAEDGSRVSVSGSLAPLGVTESRCAKFNKKELPDLPEAGNLLFVPVPGPQTYFHIHRFEDRSRLALSSCDRIGSDQWTCAKFHGVGLVDLAEAGNFYISSHIAL